MISISGFVLRTMGSSQEILGRGVLPGNRPWDGDQQAGDRLSHDCKSTRHAGPGDGKNLRGPCWKLRGWGDPAECSQVEAKGQTWEAGISSASQKGLQTLGEAASFRAVPEEVCLCRWPAGTSPASEAWHLSPGGESRWHTWGSVQICLCFISHNNSPS